MKKLLGLTLAFMLLAAGAAWAVDVSFTGSYYTRGRIFYNPDQAQNLDDDLETFMNYDHELDLRIKFQVTDNTFIYTRWEISDEGFPGDNSNDSDTAGDDNLEVQRTYGSHTFGTGTVLDLGRMTGGAWAYSFGDTATDKHRVKVTQPIPAGTLIGILEKRAENGSDAEDSEANDNDAYFLAGVFPVGNINVKPLLGYIRDGSQNLADDDHNTTFVLDLGVDGTFGMIGFESELVFQSIQADEVDLPGGEDSGSLFGFYADVWYNFGPGKVGVFGAYGSVDDDAGIQYSFGDDFDGHGSQMLGNEFEFGGASAVGGATMGGVYGSYNVSEAMSLWGQIAYAVGNADSSIEDDTALDVSATGSYKITDAVTYSVGAGYVTVSRDASGVDDPDPGYKLWHKFNIAF